MPANAFGFCLAWGAGNVLPGLSCTASDALHATLFVQMDTIHDLREEVALAQKLEGQLQATRADCQQVVMQRDTWEQSYHKMRAMMQVLKTASIAIINSTLADPGHHSCNRPSARAPASALTTMHCLLQSWKFNDVELWSYFIALHMFMFLAVKQPPTCSYICLL